MEQFHTTSKIPDLQHPLNRAERTHRPWRKRQQKLNQELRTKNRQRLEWRYWRTGNENQAPKIRPGGCEDQAGDEGSSGQATTYSRMKRRGRAHNMRRRKPNAGTELGAENNRQRPEKSPAKIAKIENRERLGSMESWRKKLEPTLAHGKRKSGVLFGPATRKADQASKTKTGVGKSGGREQKLGTMKAVSEL
jgi:hypothetical protein